MLIGVIIIAFMYLNDNRLCSGGLEVTDGRIFNRVKYRSRWSFCKSAFVVRVYCVYCDPRGACKRALIL